MGLRFFYPQESLSPRWAYSERYCSSVYPSVRMVHERPGRWRFVYTTNANEHRGVAVPLSEAEDTPNIVVLGDSYSFGAGVDDGQEYPAVLERALQGNARVINLGVGGWGLTQEIRRYHDFGVRYDPRIVILQFSANDPQDDLKCPVTEIREGRFAFHDDTESLYRIKRYLSRSFVQKSQLYNLIRDRLYRLMEARIVSANRRRLEASPAGEGGSPESALYARLLQAFVSDLHARGVSVIFLSVNNQLEEFPVITRAVRELDSEGLLRFRDAADWLRGQKDYSSPEGHLWGAPAHRIIGERLAEMIRDELGPYRVATWLP